MVFHRLLTFNFCECILLILNETKIVFIVFVEVDMIITKEVYDLINGSIPEGPPETGGILGSTKDEIIDVVIMDVLRFPVERMCSYTPNVGFLNMNIEKWSNNSISFRGVFHTHFMGVDTLSHADRQYIELIMKAMPDTVKILYFPIFVLPKREIVCYRATFRNDKTEIQREETIIKI